MSKLVGEGIEEGWNKRINNYNMAQKIETSKRGD
jgi:hypothetical protein